MLNMHETNLALFLINYYSIHKILLTLQQSMKVIAITSLEDIL